MLPNCANKFLVRFSRSLVLAVTVLATGTANAIVGEHQFGEPLKPSRAHNQTSKYIVHQLEVRHYNDLDINDQLSSEIFSSYLEMLDPDRLYLLAEDIEEFEPYRLELDRALSKGNMTPPFQIYNRYQMRLIERLEFLLDQLDGGITALDVNQDEYLELDRENAPWAGNAEDLNRLWQKRLKNAVITLRLNGKTDEEISQTLRKRYSNQLNRTLRAKPEDAFQAFMNAFTNTFDPHTQYFSPRTSENFNINMSLSLEGIGAVLQTEDEYTKVVRLVPAGPADKAGEMKPADRIVGVGQGDTGDIVDVMGWRLDEVVDLIRGPKQTSVRLEIIPAASHNESQTRVIRIVRDKVKLEEQSAQKKTFVIENKGESFKLGVIEIPTFYADFQGMKAGDPDYKSTTRDVRRLLKELSKEDIDALIIDLRNNGGGSLQEANSLTGLFIKSGPTVQVRDSKNRVDILEDPDPEILYTGPMAVIVNRLSASASEIFAGAIQDYNRGIIIGSDTFGKGTVQAIKPLIQGQLKITQAKFYRISGESTQFRGVIPDIAVPSLIDATAIGENTLPKALNWDEITPLKYQQYDNLPSLIGQLDRSHKQRMQSSDEYTLLLDEIDFIQENRDRKRISLNEEIRKQELERQYEQELTLENRKRVLDGLAPFESHELLVEHREQGTDNDDQDTPDFLLTESGHILLDLVELKQQMAIN